MEKKNRDWTNNGYCQSCLMKQRKECQRECRFAQAYRMGFDDAAAKAVRWIEDNVLDYADMGDYGRFMRAFAKAVKGGER